MDAARRSAATVEEKREGTKGAKIHEEEGIGAITLGGSESSIG